jgi:SNF2 family DNA or RNA helicase
VLLLPVLQGHKVKNAKTKLVQALRTVPAGVRVILSGTPIQNNLGEMHALFDFACEVRTLPPLNDCLPLVRTREVQQQPAHTSNTRDDTPSALLQGLLGDARHFKEYYSRPIETGNDRHAVERMRQVLKHVY